MKYIYMLCLALSSLFTYKQLAAESNMFRNAFFIPQNAFQRNVDIPDATRYSQEIGTKKEADVKEESEYSQSVVIPQARGTKAKKIAKKAVINKNEAPIVSNSETVQVNVVKNPVNVVKNENKVTQTPGLKVVEPKVKQISERDLQNKSVEKLLAMLPYPNFDQPKFKQLYALYALDLRTLYRKGELLANPEQENTLAKANTIRRFEVK